MFSSRFKKTTRRDLYVAPPAFDVSTDGKTVVLQDKTISVGTVAPDAIIEPDVKLNVVGKTNIDGIAELKQYVLINNANYDSNYYLNVNGNSLFDGKIDLTNRLLIGIPPTDDDSSFKLNVNGKSKFHDRLLIGNPTDDSSFKLNVNGKSNFHDRLLIGNPTDDSSFKLNVNGKSKFHNDIDIDTSINCLGTINTNEIVITSDYRMKTNVNPLNETHIVDNLQPVSYNKNNNKKEFGFIAHELQEHFPELVNGTKDGENMQSVNYNSLIAILVKEIQSLKQRIDVLENK